MHFSKYIYILALCTGDTLVNFVYACFEPEPERIVFLFVFGCVYKKLIICRQFHTEFVFCSLVQFKFHTVLVFVLRNCSISMIYTGCPFKVLVEAFHQPPHQSMW